MPSRSRCLALLTLILASTLAPAMTGCASPKLRENKWQFWRRQSPAPPSIFHPDRMIVPPLVEDIGRPGLAEPIELGGLPSPPEPMNEILEVSYSPLSEPIRKPATTEIASLKSIHFGYDSSELSANARAALEDNLTWLRSNDRVQVRIEGHTDERGTVEYNLLLGERRAKQVKAYLVVRGVDETILKTISYGEERPLDDRRNREAYAQNRRAQFLAY